MASCLRSLLTVRGELLRQGLSVMAEIRARVCSMKVALCAVRSYCASAFVSPNRREGAAELATSIHLPPLSRANSSDASRSQLLPFVRERPVASWPGKPLLSSDAAPAVKPGPRR